MAKSKSQFRMQKVVKDALHLILMNGGNMRLSDIITKLDEDFPNSEYEREETKSGIPRWQNWLHFYSIDAVKAGFIVKDKGMWHITDEGEQALKLSLEEFSQLLRSKYMAWKNSKSPKDKYTEQDASEGETADITFETAQIHAEAGIRAYLNNKNPYEFQFIAAALLRAMGYFTPFVAPKGKDGGIDIIAYRDPLGASLPRLKAQVKHYPNSALSCEVVRNLVGVLANEGEVGIVITSGTFTNDAKREARVSHRPVRLIDIDEFISLWIKYYDSMEEQDKNLLPITPIYFIQPRNEQ